MDPTITVTNQPGPAPHAGRSFTVRYVPAGGTYGRNGVFTADEPQVEFYDATYADNPGFADMTVNGQVVGQFTGGRYYATTLSERGGGYGLNLDGGIPEWTVDAAAMTRVGAWLASVETAVS